MISRNEKTNGTVGVSQKFARQRDKVLNYFQKQLREKPPEVFDTEYVTNLFRQIEQYIDENDFFLPKPAELGHLEWTGSADDVMTSDYGAITNSRQWKSACMRGIARIAKSYVKQEENILL